MSDEVKLLPGEGVDLAMLPEIIGGILFADPVCGGRVSTGTIKALCDLVTRAIEATRPTDEVVERVARAVAADQLKRRYGPGWDRLTRYGKAHLKHDVRAAIAAMKDAASG